MRHIVCHRHWLETVNLCCRLLRLLGYHCLFLIHYSICHRWSAEHIFKAIDRLRLRVWIAWLYLSSWLRYLEEIICCLLWSSRLVHWHLRLLFLSWSCIKLSPIITTNPIIAALNKLILRLICSRRVKVK